MIGHTVTPYVPVVQSRRRLTCSRDYLRLPQARKFGRHFVKKVLFAKICLI